MFGRMYNVFWAKTAALMIFVGFNLTFLPQFIMGSKGMPRRYYTYLQEYQTMHVISTTGSWLLALGMFIVLIYMLHSIFKGKVADKNPWGALTLEWETSSPPDPHNFEGVPQVKHGPYDYDKVLIQPTVN